MQNYLIEILLWHDHRDKNRFTFRKYRNFFVPMKKEEESNKFIKETATEATKYLYKD